MLLIIKLPYTEFVIDIEIVNVILLKQKIKC